ncbi:hypothetical protein ACFFK0_12290 [Paenibacillus chartarius]|uniref:DUF2269 family protein n=1 Tax=Paenibacillus chartarius TaxID=747481 RepID=A0ABV6DKP3_9BACL
MNSGHWGYNIALAGFVHLLAWMLIILTMFGEAFSWVLIPPVNNRPAFITISLWLLEGMAVAWLIVSPIHKLMASRTADWPRCRLGFQLALSFLHIIVIALLIIAVAGSEDL